MLEEDHERLANHERCVLDCSWGTLRTIALFRPFDVVSRLLELDSAAALGD